MFLCYLPFLSHETISLNTKLRDFFRSKGIPTKPFENWNEHTHFATDKYMNNLIDCVLCMHFLFRKLNILNYVDLELKNNFYKWDDTRTKLQKPTEHDKVFKCIHRIEMSKLLLCIRVYTFYNPKATIDNDSFLNCASVIFDYLFKHNVPINSTLRYHNIKNILQLELIKKMMSGRDPVIPLRMFRIPDPTLIERILVKYRSLVLQELLPYTELNFPVGFLKIATSHYKKSIGDSQKSMVMSFFYSALYKNFHIYPFMDKKDPTINSPELNPLIEEYITELFEFWKTNVFSDSDKLQKINMLRPLEKINNTYDTCQYEGERTNPEKRPFTALYMLGNMLFDIPNISANNNFIIRNKQRYTNYGGDPFEWLSPTAEYPSLLNFKPCFCGDTADKILELKSDWESTNETEYLNNIGFVEPRTPKPFCYRLRINLNDHNAIEDPPDLKEWDHKTAYRGPDKPRALYKSCFVYKLNMDLMKIPSGRSLRVDCQELWDHSEKVIECPICYENLDPFVPRAKTTHQMDVYPKNRLSEKFSSNGVTLLSCGHRFHRTCIPALRNPDNSDRHYQRLERYMRNGISCPMCRTNQKVVSSHSILNERDIPRYYSDTITLSKKFYFIHILEAATNEYFSYSDIETHLRRPSSSVEAFDWRAEGLKKKKNKTKRNKRRRRRKSKRKSNKK